MTAAPARALLCILLLHLGLVWALPPVFVENRGQARASARFMTDLPGGRLFLEDRRLVLVLLPPGQFGHTHAHDGAHDHDRHEAHADADRQLMQGQVVHIEFEGCRPDARPEAPAEALVPGLRNYFLGNDPRQWAEGCRTWSQIVYPQLWPGIDLRLSFAPDGLKYDLLLQPGADPGRVKLRYRGHTSLALQQGQLVWKAAGGEVHERIPAAWWTLPNGERQPAPVQFSLQGQRVGFVAPDAPQPGAALTIDPVLVFASFSGSPADNFGFTATYDSSGNTFGGGTIYQFTSAGGGILASYPATPGAFQTTFQGGDTDIGITKFNANGTAVIYATYIGGNGTDQPHSIIADDLGRLYILAYSTSTNLPFPAGGYDLSANGNGDIAVIRLNANGGGIRGTYVGGSSFDGVVTPNVFAGGTPLNYYYADSFRGEVVLDALGRVVVASSTASSNFPVTAGVFDNSFNGVLDAVVFRLDPDLSTLQWSTFLGGSQHDAGYSLKTTPNNNVVVAGGTTSTNLPTSAGAWRTAFQGGRADGFVFLLDSNGVNRLAGTYVGTTAYDQAFFVDLSTVGEVYLLGHTSGNFPVTKTPATGYIQPSGGQFITALNQTLTTQVMGTRFGRNDGTPDLSLTAFSVDICDNIYLSGWGGPLAFNNFSVVNPFPDSSSTQGLTVTGDAFQPTTDGSDFYFLVLHPNADSLFFASFLGGNGTGDHVDGGTSRFDPSGNIFQATCAACGPGTFPTTPGVVYPTVPVQNQNCNMAVARVNFDLLDVVQASLSLSISSNGGCAPFTVTFTPSSANADLFIIELGDTAGTSVSRLPTDPPFSFVYTDTGQYLVRLIAFSNDACIQFDTLQQLIDVDQAGNPAFSYALDTCQSFDVQFTNQTQNLTAPGTTFEWNFGDGTTSTLLNPTHSYAAAGTYNVRLIVNFGSTCPDTVVLPVSVPAFPNASIGFSQPACDSTFVFNATVLPGHTYAWSFGDGTTATGTNPTHTYPDTGSFTVRLVANNGFCTDTSTQVLNVKPRPVPSFARPDTLCQLDAAFAYTGQFATQWLWDFGDGTTSSLPSPSHTYASPGVYAVKLVVNPGQLCTDSLTQAVLIPTLFTAQFATTYTPCDSVASFQDLSTGGAQWLWSFGDGSTSSLPNPSHTYAGEGTFEVRLVLNPDSLCPDTLLDSLSIDLEATALFALPDSLCDSVLAPVDQSLQANTYAWTVTDPLGNLFATRTDTGWALPLPTDGLWTLQLITEPGTNCPDTLAQTLLVVATVPAAFTATPTEPCSRGLLFEAQGPPGTLFAWNYGNGQTATGPDSLYVYPTDGVYDVQLLTNPHRLCPDTARQTVVVGRALVNASFTLPDSICGRFVAPANTSQGTTTQQWLWGDGATSSLVQPTHTYASLGAYTVELLTDAGTLCADTFAQSIVLLPQPTAGFSIAQQPCAPELTMTNTSTGANTFLWLLGDGRTLTDPNPVFSYPSYGPVSISLIAIDANGCTDTLQANYPYDPLGQANLLVPNVFSPNGDGINETFTLQGVNVNCVTEILVFDRWGNQIFLGEGPEEPWDGQVNGKPASEGAYVYVIRTQHGFERVGTVTLLR